MALVEEVVMVPIGSVRAAKRNPRRGDVVVIKESLAANGQYRPLVVNRPTMEVLAGNHTLVAARELGWETILVGFVDVSEGHATRIKLVDNRSSDLACWDDAELAELLGEVEDLTGTGFSRADLDALLDLVSADVPVAEDEVPALPEQPVTQPGDVLVLGRHRLACGDARDEALIDQLMEDEPAACLLTDPPYGAQYAGKTKRRLRIRNDDRAGLGELVPAAFRVADAQLCAGAAVYVFHPTGAALGVFVEAFLGAGWQLRQSLVWVKDAMVLGHADYHYRHESILYGFTASPGSGRRGRGGDGWYGDNSQDSVIELPRPRAAREHPTMKPPELLARLLRNSTRRGDLVFDPFAGSGSTLVACEHLGRQARLVELDPAYCDVIAERYGRLIGQTSEAA
jgi:site-specific DNA-methyltransferase (adenine-specific)